MPHVHNALHHATSLQDAFRKALGEGDAAFNGIERAGETLTPVIDIWSLGEWAALRGEVLWTLTHDQPAVAAEQGFVGVRNPADSGVIVVILGIRADTGATLARAVLNHGVISATDVDGSEDIAPRDTRFPLTGVGPMVKIHGAGAAAIGNSALDQIVIPANDSREFEPVPRIITPGFELRVYNNTVNVQISVTMWGYMRRALPGELAIS